MNKIILFLIIIIIGCLAKQSEFEVTTFKSDIKLVKQDCAIKAIKICGTDDTPSTNRCLERFVKTCQKNSTNVVSKHTFKTSLVENDKAKRICITDSNCNCKTIASNTCLNTEGDYDTCVRQTKTDCKQRCSKSKKCYRVDCKNAGRKRCNENASIECSIKHPNSLERRDECVQKKSKYCRKHERANCHKARRVYSFRIECSDESELKCTGILDKKSKCTCVSQTRHACLVNKIKSHRRRIRRVFDCDEASKIICSEKPTRFEYKQCLKKEKRTCEPVCDKETRKKCGNQVNGPCFKKEHKLCIKKWKRHYCDQRAKIRCAGDDECLQTQLDQCNNQLPPCFTGKVSCNDNNKCTKDICDPVQGCLNLPISCEDNNACTSKTCDPVLGCVYKTKDCDDGVLCTLDTCNARTGNCKHTFDKSICWSCKGGPCQVDTDCDAWSLSQNLDASCQRAQCNAQTGSCVALQIDNCAKKCKKSCLPYHACDVASCVLNNDSGIYDCVHTDKSCNDHKSCTIDTCDKKSGCVHTINTATCGGSNQICDTDLDCKQWEQTNDLKKKCQKAKCHIKKGVCIAETTSNECNVEECQKTCRSKNSCETAKCISGTDSKTAYCARTPIICDDGKSCTIDSCDAIVGCVFKYRVNEYCPPSAQCTRDSDCTQYELNENLDDQCLKAVCDRNLGACTKVPQNKQCKKHRKNCIQDCIPNDACDDAKCIKDDSGLLTCQHSPKTCDDGVQCTQDSCDAVQGCVFTYIGDDINCPYNGQCKVDNDCIQWGFSQKLASICQKPVCDRVLGACRAIAKNKDCSSTQQCNSTTCVAQNPCETAFCQIDDSGKNSCVRIIKNCNDFNNCTLDSCDNKNGKCINTPINSLECLPKSKIPSCPVKCQPRNVCETATCVQDEVTNVYSCQYAPKSCDDGKTCTVDKCDLALGCVNTYVVSSQCPKGLQCKVSDDCAQYALKHKLASKCKVASCDQTQGRCVSSPTTDNTCVPSTQCTDCTPSNLCESASCSKGSDGSVSCVRVQNTCNDNLICTVDSCDIKTGKCINTYTVSDSCPSVLDKCTKNIDCKQWALNKNVDTKCLTPTCDSKLGTCITVPNGNDCSKKTCKKQCTPKDACEDSTCSYDVSTKKVSCTYTRKVCDDKNPCTRDSCDVSKGCVFTPDSSITGCNTPNCKTSSDCSAWASKQITDSCQQAICDSVTKTCKAVLINNPTCNPILKICKKNCKPNNACEDAVCQVDAKTKKYSCARTTTVCNDNNPCTVDTCDQVKGCTFTYQKSTTCHKKCKIDSDCASYGLKKQASLNCQVPVCDKATTTCTLQQDSNPNCKSIVQECELICKAKNACDQATCVRTPGTNKLSCQHTPIVCNDNKSCTTDSCDAKLGCQFVFKKSGPCGQPCDKDLDCTAWGTSQNLADKCQKAVCDTKLGACKVVKGPQTSKCATTDECTFSTDCPQAKFGTACCVDSGLKKCIDNECETDLDCVPKDGNTWGYCTPSGTDKFPKSSCGKTCHYKKKCKKNTDCNDSNPCTRDVCLKDYGFCKNLPRCVDNNCCTLDICVAGTDGVSYTCKNPVRSCTTDKTLLDKNYDLLSSSQKTAWLGKCSPTQCCITCVVNAQCNDNNGCTTDSCQNQYCVNAPIDNKWCDPVISGQAITVEGYFPTFTRI